LVSFAVTTGNVNEVITNDAKAAGHKVVLLAPEYGEDNLPKADSLIALFNKVTALMRAGKVYSAYTPTFGGVAEAIYKMCIGNGFGFAYDKSMSLDDIFGYNYGAFVLEVADDVDGKVVGTITDDGKFTYGEAQYNHDIRNMEGSFRSSGGEDWKKYAGIPPMWYPTHSTAMILSTMPGVYAKKVVALGFAGSPRTDIYGTEGQNIYNNPFSNTTMLLELSNGGIARLCENRCIGWVAPETYIAQYYGTDGGYEFSVARHSLCTWKEDGKTTKMVDVSAELQPKDVMDNINENYEDAIQKIAEGAGWGETYPIQSRARLPKEYEGMVNGHNGTHHFIIDDFCRAYETGKLSPTNIWAVARYNIPGLTAQKSALAGGVPMDVIDLGDPPADWEVLPDGVSD
jgi:hypothetical protein